MKRISFCVLLILFLVIGSTYASDQKLSSAYEQELIQRVKGIFGSDDQTQKILHPARPVCATPIIVEVFDNYDKLSPEARRLLSSLIDPRPDHSWTDPRTYDSEADYFKIHYVVSGEDSVFESSVDLLPADGHPDYVNRCADILDYVWEYEIDTLGYNQPPSDWWHSPNGGDGKYDVYLTHMQPGYLGVTYPEDWYTYPTAISYVVLRNDYSIYTQPPYSLWEDQYDGMKVTAAHEFFHAIQLGYDAIEYGGTCPGPNCRPYWMEMTAVWMEDVVYDEINDYLGYLYYFFHFPWLSLKAFSSEPTDGAKYFHAYASCVWPIYLSEKFGSEIIRQIWIECGELAGDNAFSAIDEILTSIGSSFDQAFQEFTIWNYFTYSRADTQTFYSEGHLFDPIFIYGTQEHGSGSYPLTVNTIPKRPENLGSNYVSFKTNTGVLGDLNVGFYGDSIATWEVSLIGYKAGNPPWFSQINLNGLQNGAETVFDWQLYDRIIMIPAVTTQQDNSFGYAYAATVDTASDVDEESGETVPSSVKLFQNYPNPFNSTTLIPFTVNSSLLTENGPIRTSLKIYNILGQEIKTLVDEEKLPGTYEISWDGMDNSGIEVASGIYFYKLRAGQHSQVKKMLLVK
jgi:hypothetical protein